MLLAEAIPKSDCYATSEFLIFLLANIAMIGLVGLRGKSKAEGGAYFRSSPPRYFAGRRYFVGGEWRMGNGQRAVGSGEGSWKGNFLFPTPHSPLPIPEILSPKLLMKTGVGSFYPCLNAGPYCGALIVPGLCGGAINPYNGASNFVAAY